MLWNKGRPNLPTGFSGTCASSFPSRSTMKTADAALEIRLGVPGDFRPLISLGRDLHVERSGRRSGVADGAGLDVFHPGLGHRSLGSQTDSLGLPLYSAAGTAVSPPKRRQPGLAHVHRLEGLVLAPLVRQPHRQAGIQEGNGEVAAVAALVAGARVAGEAGRPALDAVTAGRWPAGSSSGLFPSRRPYTSWGWHRRRRGLRTGGNSAGL